MPSDDRVQLALEAFAAGRDAFQAALETTVEQVQAFLREHRGSENGKTNRIAAELGPFGASRIDTERLSTVFADRVVLDRVTLETIEAARETMRELAKRNHQLFLVDAKPGTDVGEAVGRAFEEIGRAFGAVRIFELTRSGSYHGNEHARSLGAFPFVKWSRGERRMAPPIVVTVDGADCHAESLAQFMDGHVKIVMVIRGSCAPAPLVRLITPGTFVTQTTDGRDLARLAGFAGPGAAALVPESAAQFVHDPAAGKSLWERLEIRSLPEQEPRLTLGGRSGAQQAEELRQLKAMAQRPAAPEPAAAPTGEAAPPALADPVDKLAAWLLNQADLSDIA